jgi:hypothetical protein
MPETPNLVIGDNGWQHAPGLPGGEHRVDRDSGRHVCLGAVRRQKLIRTFSLCCVCTARVRCLHRPFSALRRPVWTSRIYCMHAAGERGPTRREQRKGATCDAGVRHVRRLVVRTRWNAMHMIMHDDR